MSLPRLQQAIGRLAPKLARAKGLFETVDQPGRLTVFQLAGGRATLAPGGVAAGVPRTRIRIHCRNRGSVDHRNRRDHGKVHRRACRCVARAAFKAKLDLPHSCRASICRSGNRCGGRGRRATCAPADGHLDPLTATSILRVRYKGGQEGARVASKGNGRGYVGSNSRIWAAVATPLTADGSVDNAKLAGHALGLFKRGLDGVVLFGTTGEGTSFNVAERIATVEALLKAGIAAPRIGLGGGFPAITDGIALTRSALSLGVNHVLLLPPYFDRSVTPDGIEHAFAAIFDAVADDRLRATLYHIPQVSGVAVPAQVAANFAQALWRAGRRPEGFQRRFPSVPGIPRRRARTCDHGRQRNRYRARDRRRRRGHHPAAWPTSCPSWSRP